MTAPAYHPHDPDDHRYDGAKEIVDAEVRHIQRWRGVTPRHGLALSGGGIRAASYCLGVLQALANEHKLEEFDYLSTVSGGGYIGTSVSYLLHEAGREARAEGRSAARFDASRENFPYLSYPMVSAPQPGAQGQFREKGRLLHRLRQNAKYLTSGTGITLLSLVGNLLRNLLASVFVHGAILLLLMLALITAPWLLPEIHWQVGTGKFWWPDIGVLKVSWAALLLLGAISLLYVTMTGLFDWVERSALRRVPRGDGLARVDVVYRARRAFDVWVSWLLALVLACLVIGAVPWVIGWLQEARWKGVADLLSALSPDQANRPLAVGGVAAVVGLLGNVWGLVQTGSDKKPRIPTSVLVLMGSALLLFGVLLLVYVLALWAHEQPARQSMVVFSALGVLIALGWFPDANYVSLHRFYRDRLMELFMPDLKQVSKSLDERSLKKAGTVGLSVPGDKALLAELCGNSTADRLASPLNGPYHLINANVVLVASKHPRYKARGGDNFILSPLVCGSRATGWSTTIREPGKGLTVATAMAISGAALNPNAGGGGEGITRQPLLSVLMGMLNLRLGYWFDNPNGGDGSGLGSKAMKLLGHWRANPLSPGLAETFARKSLNEHEAHVLLTDGGHFENLGLYELVRRRLPLIVVCDATADKDFKFTDLANAIERVRADFGAIIRIAGEDLAALVPGGTGNAKGDGIARPAERGYLFATIDYSLQPGETTGQKGRLVLLKATSYKNLPADLHSYRRANPDFPNQSTSDQFFDEKKFEAYRELGFMTCRQMLKKLPSEGSVEQEQPSPEVPIEVTSS